MREHQIYCVYVWRFEQTPRPTAVFVVWRREEPCWVRCPARRTQASEPRLTAFGLAAKRRGERARANLSWYFVFHFVTGCCCCTATFSTSTRTYPRRDASRVRFSWYLGPSPHQATVVWPRRDATPAARGSGAKQRRYIAVSPSNSWIVLLLFAVVDNILNIESIPFFDLRMTEIVEFWAKIRRLGSSDSQIEKFPVGFCIFGLHKQDHSFSRLKNRNLKLELEPHRKQPKAFALVRIAYYYV